MNSPKSCSSPTYKNLKFKHIQSPIELKNKLRKDYKSKVQNCRDMLLNKFRGNTLGPDIQNTLTEIYKKLYDFSDHILTDDEASNMLEEIKSELIQEEIEWWLDEYDKSHFEIDWSVYQQEENIICPICQKTNFEFASDAIVCPICKITVKTNETVLNTKKAILEGIEKHNSSCTEEPQFTAVTEANDTHIYLLCCNCNDMWLVV